MCVMPMVVSTQPEDILEAENKAVKTQRKGIKMSLFLNALEWQLSPACVVHK